VRIALIVALVASTAAAAAQARPPAPLVTLEQRGGFAGIERGLFVERSGKVVSDGLAVTTHRLTAAQLRALRASLVAARFPTLARHYESDRPIADGFVYRLSYGGRTVQWEENADLPARLQRCVDLLTALVQE
jgi:hypothetical protein